MILTLGKWMHGNGRGFSGEEPGAVLELDGDPHVRPAGAVRYDLFAQCAGTSLIVRGTVSARVSMNCSRCGKWFERRVETRDFFRVIEDCFEGCVVDLTADIREDILLAFPFVALCSESCRGLCPKCGADGNTAPCDCKPDGSASWGGFDGVSIPGL